MFCRKEEERRKKERKEGKKEGKEKKTRKKKVKKKKKKKKKKKEKKKRDQRKTLVNKMESSAPRRRDFVPTLRVYFAPTGSDNSSAGDPPSAAAMESSALEALDRKKR